MPAVSLGDFWREPEVNIQKANFKQCIKFHLHLLFNLKWHLLLGCAFLIYQPFVVRRVC